MSWISSLIGGAFGAFGSMANSALTYAQNKDLIKYQQDWQERMSNTMHQREVKDLRAAGLNPILSATGGSGASFGSASAPTSDVDIGIERGLNTALAIKQQKNADKLADSQADANWSDSHLKQMQWNLTHEQSENEFLRSNNIRAERASILQQIENSKALTNAQVYNLVKNADANYMNAQTNLKTYGINSARANADIKYTNERSRGFSSSDSVNVGVPGFNFGYGKHRTK